MGNFCLLLLVEVFFFGFIFLSNDIANVSDHVVIRVYFGQSETWQFKQGEESEENQSKVNFN